MNKRLLSLALVPSALLTLAGCGHHDAPVMMAPPTQPVTVSQPGDPQNAQMAGQTNGQVYNWTEVPVGQQVPIQRAVFDGGGYQLFSQEGTIVVPFANQNMYVMKFGQSQSGSEYFVNNGSAPTLYLPSGGSLENAAQPGARWYPFPQNYNYNGPVYVGLAPSWSAYQGMGWYPGMSSYGGYYGYSPLSIIGPMVGLHFLIGGSPYYGWNSYHSYYNSHPYQRVAPRVVSRTVYNQAARTSFNRGSSLGSGGRRFGSAGTSFGGRPNGGGFGSRPSGGSFGSGAPSGYSGTNRATSGSFGRSPSGFGGSFGARRPAVSTPSGPAVSAPSASTSSGSFGSGRPNPPSASFGSGRPSSSGSGSFGGSRPSFGGGSSAPSRPSFGGFGGGHSSFGGGSFGGGHSSFGGGHSSFGGGRRR